MFHRCLLMKAPFVNLITYFIVCGVSAQFCPLPHALRGVCNHKKVNGDLCHSVYVYITKCWGYDRALYSKDPNSSLMMNVVT